MRFRPAAIVCCDFRAPRPSRDDGPARDTDLASSGRYGRAASHRGPIPHTRPIDPCDHACAGCEHAAARIGGQSSSRRRPRGRPRELPRALLDAGSLGGNIIALQPRACRRSARRFRRGAGQPVGASSSILVRFEMWGSRTRIRFAPKASSTGGCCGPDLAGVVRNADESLNATWDRHLAGVAARLLRDRAPTKVCVMSATLERHPLRLLDGCPRVLTLDASSPVAWIFAAPRSAVPRR